MNVGSVTRLRSAPGRSCEMMWDKTVEHSQSCCERTQIRLCILENVTHHSLDPAPPLLMVSTSGFAWVKLPACFVFAIARRCLTVVLGFLWSGLVRKRFVFSGIPSASLTAQ